MLILEPFTATLDRFVFDREKQTTENATIQLSANESIELIKYVLDYLKSGGTYSSCRIRFESLIDMDKKLEILKNLSSNSLLSYFKSENVSVSYWSPNDIYYKITLLL